jgi:hypothetical protein
MPLQSDIAISVAKFNPATNSEQSKQLNEGLIKMLGGGPKWFEVCLLSLLSGSSVVQLLMIHALR